MLFHVYFEEYSDNIPVSIDYESHLFRQKKPDSSKNAIGLVRYVIIMPLIVDPLKDSRFFPMHSSSLPFCFQL
jgi:hypothetical protein